MHCAKAAFRSIFASILMATTLSERSSSLRTSSKASSASVSRLAYFSKKLSQSLGPRRSSLSISKAALVGSELVAMTMPKVLIKARRVETKVAFIVVEYSCIRENALSSINLFYLWASVRGYPAQSNENKLFPLLPDCRSRTISHRREAGSRSATKQHK